jgi:hypothetical protein
MPDTESSTFAGDLSITKERLQRFSEHGFSEHSRGGCRARRTLWLRKSPALSLSCWGLF